MVVPTAPVATTRDQSQAARVAVIRVLGSHSSETRVLATQWLLGNATFFGQKDDTKVERMLEICGVQTDLLRSIFDGLLR